MESTVASDGRGQAPLWGSLWGSLTPKRADFGGLGRISGTNEKEPKAAEQQDFRLFYEVGGTGLEPVTPSLSIRSSVRVSSLMFAQSVWLSVTSRRANT
jgi:hypothetical protein